MHRRDLVPSEVATGVHRYGSRYINCYLIEDRDRLTLLDSGLPRYVRQLRGALARLGRSVRDIDAILLTHCHIDHTGAAKQIQFESSARVFVHETDAPTVGGDRKQPLPRLGTKLLRPALFTYLTTHLAPNGAARYPTVAEVSTFSDGETLDVPGSPRVLHVPGHTPGSSALVLEDRKVLFSGDALVTLDTMTGDTGPHLFTPPFTEDYPTARKSLDRLAEVDADLTLPGHGEPWTGRIQEAVTIARQRANR